MNIFMQEGISLLSELKSGIYSHINKNSYKYFFLLLCFCAGILCGALFSTGVPSDKSDLLSEYVNNFCLNINNGGVTFNSVLKNQIIKTIRTTLLLSFCTVSSFFIPIIFINSLSSGFVTGFTLCFLSRKFGFEGFILSIVSVLPEVVVCFPVTLLLSVVCLNFIMTKKSLHNNKTSVKGLVLKIGVIFILRCVLNIAISPALAEFTKAAGGLIIR